MMTFVAIVHILFCFSLIALVLLQDPKGGGAGIFGGGGGANTLLGATGQTTFFARMTKWSAVVFGVTCLTMTILTRKDAGSVIDSSLGGAPIQAPASGLPGAPAPGATNQPAQDAQAVKNGTAPVIPAGANEPSPAQRAAEPMNAAPAPVNPAAPAQPSSPTGK